LSEVSSLTEAIRDALTPRQQARQTRDAQVHAAFNLAKQRYGAPRITVDLYEAGFGWNRKTVADSLRRQGLKARATRRFFHNHPKPM